MSPSPGYRWHPITDLDEHDFAASSEELPALVATWADQRAHLDQHQVEEFNERLDREWAIETGIIERIYSLDRGITQLLIERGIDASLISRSDTNQPPELVAGIISDQQSAIDWLFHLVKKRRVLSTAVIKELHALMTNRQTHTDGQDQFGRPVQTELIHREYKRWPNNPSRPDGSLHEYCPPEQVASEMDRLVELHLQHQDQGVPPDVEAAWLHHRFAQIHPFQDGNGRVARALASLVLIEAGWLPLTVNRDDRDTYITALEDADRGQLRPLIQLFGAIEKRWLVKALSIGDQVERDARRVDQMIDAIGTMFSERDQKARQQFDQAKTVAGGLWSRTRNRFEQVSHELERRIGNGASSRGVRIDSADDRDDDRRFWHRYQVIHTASELDYYANMSEFHQWVRLRFTTENGRSEILVSFHGIGHDYRGLVGASACFYRREKADDIEQQVIELRPVSEALFQINYKESPESVEQRFGPWLEAALLRGLDEWRRGE